MVKRSRLGKKNGNHPRTGNGGPADRDPLEITSFSYRGKSPSQKTRFLIRGFEEFPIVYQNVDKLYLEFIKGRAESSLVSLRKKLTFITKYSEWFAIRFSQASHSNAVPNIDFISSIFDYLENERSKYAKMKFFRRFLRAIGVPSEIIPINPYKANQPKIKETSSLNKTRSILKTFKNECSIIKSRSKECADIIDKGRDPRRQFGGKHGDWSRMENRMYVLRNVIGIDIRNIELMRPQGLRTAIAGFERFPGAVTLRSDGAAIRKGGVTGHLRWFYPCLRDLFPFVALLQLRTNFNISNITGLHLGGYEFRDSPLQFFGKLDQITQFSVQKFKTVNDPDGEPSFVRAMTLKHPSSYPLKLIRFLEELRAPLAQQIIFLIENLEKLPSLNRDQIVELERLRTIKKDLFLYYTDGTVRSLGEYARKGEIPSSFIIWMKALNFPTEFNNARNTGLANGLIFSGGNDRMITLLANHMGGTSSKYYSRRRNIIDILDKFFIEYFEVSISLIKSKNFSKSNLRVIFTDRGFSRREIDNILSDDTITHWGNRCASPRKPPGDFAKGTPPGHVCVGQNCIDGCPNAIWFPSALEIVRRKRDELVAKRSTLNFLVSSSGFINQHIARCEYIIAQILANAA